MAMPSDVYEDTVFLPSTPPALRPNTIICFSAYQRKLNELYIIASPAIERLYSARESRNPKAAEEYVSTLQRVTKKLSHWRQQLPAQLSLDVDHEYASLEDPAERAHQLQSLSLHLTFESLQIILHRPFLKQQLRLMHTGVTPRSPTSAVGSSIGRPGSVGTPNAIPTEPLGDIGTSSPRQWWEAASRIARTTELLDLTHAATDTHLVSFLALNLFNAAVVLIVLALSDPLNNSAQQAKRAVARIYRLQIMLGSRSVLGEQSGRVISTLTELLLHREREAILAQPVLEPSSSLDDVPSGNASGARGGSGNQSAVLQSPADGDPRPRQDWLDAGSNGADLATRLDSSLASVQNGKFLKGDRCCMRLTNGEQSSQQRRSSKVTCTRPERPRLSIEIGSIKSTGSTIKQPSTAG